MKLITEVEIPKPGFELTFEDKIISLGSCFADNISAKLSGSGFSVCANPFGPLYNPGSICYAINRLCSEAEFGPEDCVELGAGAGLYGSFGHYTKFARRTPEEFLNVANRELHKACKAWRDATCIIVTLGTAEVWRLKQTREIVVNCLKRPTGEFTHELLSAEEVYGFLDSIMFLCRGRKLIFTVSPIRHIGSGVHRNTLSKALLQLSVEKVLSQAKDYSSEPSDGPMPEYFPSYEILLDELRGYRYYAEDLCHPSPLAVEYIWEKFTRAYVPEKLWSEMKANEKAQRAFSHIPFR